jgi:predicted nucleotidyltransferase
MKPAVAPQRSTRSPSTFDCMRSKGGRFLLYGSAARGEIRFDSDIDLLVDFPADSESEAWRLAEDVCAAHGMEANIMPLAWCTPRFIAHVLPQAVVLG